MSSDAYAARERERDKAYAEAWDSPEVQSWIASLSHEDRQEMASRGLLAPLCETGVSGANLGLLDDAASQAFVGPDVYDEEEVAISSSQTASNGGGAVSDDRLDPREARGDILASFCARLRSSPRPALVFDAICYATGVLALEGASATELAAQHGVTKQAFSKIAVEWCETFGLPPARAMKSKRARKAYKERAKRVHERNSKLTRKEMA